VVFAHAVPDWENRKPALRSNIVKIDTTIYDAQEISGKKKTEFFDGLRRMTNLHRDRRLWHAQHEDGEGDHVPAAGLIRIQQDEQAIRTALRL
jgi:hypothetical protein